MNISAPVAARISSAARSKSEGVRGANGYPCALLGQYLGASPAQPLAGAAHNRYLTVELQVIARPPEMLAGL